MIGVFCEEGGHLLLGKAREIADDLGDRVLAFATDGDSESLQKLIYLGADEVLSVSLTRSIQWAPVISHYLSTERSVRMMIFPSNPNSNALMGLICGSIPDKVSFVLDDAVSLTVEVATKRFESNLLIEKRIASEKTALVSLQNASVAIPFEDSSRFGKIKTLEVPNDQGDTLFPLNGESNSRKLVVLLGKGTSDKTAQLATRVASKYGGDVKTISGKIDIIYGPCLAVEVTSKVKDLPEFKSDLIAISSGKFPINSIAEVSAISEDLDGILENL
jgi:hypothetical protein